MDIEEKKEEESSVSVNVSVDKDDKSLSDTALEEVTKATISQSIGTLIYPITREIAQLEEAAITKLKNAIHNRRKRKLVEANKETIIRIEKRVENDPEQVEIVEKLHDLVESASEKELDNKELFLFWGSLISRLEKGDKDYELLLQKLKELNSAEAEYLLYFKSGKRRAVDVNPFLRAIRFSGERDEQNQRNVQLALSLKEKGILEQPFSIVRAVFALLTPIVIFLVMAEGLRPILERANINVSSANIVILLGVLGVLFGAALLSVMKKPTRLTWLGRKLREGANGHYEEE